MANNRLTALKVLLILMTCWVHVHGQTTEALSDTARKNSVNIFIDCSTCDLDYFREQLTYLNFVRESTDAHVHILITSQVTGSRGTEYSLLFLGQKQFAGQIDTLMCNTLQDATPDEIRKTLAKMIKLGTVRYIAKFPVSALIDISYYTPQVQKIVEDKWHSWVLQIDFGGYASGEDSYSSTSLWSSLSAQKVTPDWKLQFEAGNYYTENVYKLSDYKLKTIYRENYFNHKAVKSLTNHWSVGEGLSVSTTTYSNYDLFYSIYPLIEYDLFPYDQSTRKQLRVLYGVGYEHSDYIDTTIFNKTKEGRYGQKFMISFQLKQKWGSVTMTARSFNYLDNFSLHNIRLQPEISWRIFKGLSFTLSGTIGWLRDQINLPKAGLSYEEILLKQKQLATSYFYSTNFGLTYSFGSIYNNVVNPRFGGYY
jgi:hypothetical protein